MLKAKNVRPSVRTLGNKNFTRKASLPFIENPSDKPSNTAPVINKPMPENKEPYHNNSFVVGKSIYRVINGAHVGCTLILKLQIDLLLFKICFGVGKSIYRVKKGLMKSNVGCEKVLVQARNIVLNSKLNVYCCCYKSIKH